MKFVKLLAVMFTCLAVIVAITAGTTYCIASKLEGPGVALDITYVLTRPLYLLVVAVVVGLAGWVCRRWVFV